MASHKSLQRFLENPLGIKALCTAILIVWGWFIHYIMNPIDALTIPYLLFMALLVALSWRMHHFWIHRKQRKQKDYWILFASGLAIMTVLVFVTDEWAMIFIPIGTILVDISLTQYARERHMGGTKLDDFQDVFRAYEKDRLPQDKGILWGGTLRPTTEAMTHFLVAGASGSGKTLTIRMYLQSVLPSIRSGAGKRAMIYDAKRDTIAMLQGMNVTCPIHVLNPFDDRCAAWDMAKDIESFADIEATVNILFPKDPNAKEEPFWLDTSRELLTGILKAFMIYAPGEWTLRDVVIAMSNLQFVRVLLSKDFETSQHLGVLGGTDGTVGNIMSTIAAKMRPYRLIAAYWHNAAYHISLKEWTESDSIIVLGKDRRAAESLNALNQLIFVRAIDMQLEKREVSEPHTFVVFDEFQGAGKIDRFKDMVEQGRSKGIAALIGFQAYSAIEAVYGEQETTALIGQFKNKCLLRAQDEKTAKWMSEQFGEKEISRMGLQVGHDKGVDSLTGKSESFDRKPAVLPAEFLNLPQPERGSVGLTGYYTGKFKYTTSYSPVHLSEILQGSGPDSANYLPAPTHYERLKPWTEEDVQRLNFPMDVMALALPQAAGAALEKSDTAVTPELQAPNSPDEPAMSPTDRLLEELKRQRN